MTLTEKWETCPTCGGTEEVDAYGLKPTREVGRHAVGPCPDCVDGLVPPEGMVEAAAEAEWNALGEYETWDDLPADGQLRPHFMRAARAALVAAKRWEKE